MDDNGRHLRSAFDHDQRIPILDVGGGRASESLVRLIVVVGEDKIEFSLDGNDGLDVFVGRVGAVICSVDRVLSSSGAGSGELRRGRSGERIGRSRLASVFA